MKPVKGFKIFNVGDDDWVVANDIEGAKEVIYQMIDKNWVDEEVKSNPVREITDQEFTFGRINHDLTGELEGPCAPLITLERSLNFLIETNEPPCHFMTNAEQ